MEDRVFLLGFANAPGIGPNRFAKVLATFGNAKTAWYAQENELQELLKPAITKKFVEFRKSFSFDEYLEKMQKAKVFFVTQDEKDYPDLLREIINPPIVLFVKGNKKILQKMNTIGVVGTRKITDYGRQVTEAITRELVDAGCVIVSGLAMGVDAVSHQTTIDQGGKTIAVLGCGVDCCYPRENQQIYESILDNDGLIVSEYGIGQQPTIGSFPSRNRIIAGLSHGVLVTEGAADSGALITAKDALSIGRKIFAVPGPVTSSLSQGTYQLIKQGAVVVSSGREIVEDVGFKIKDLPAGKAGLKNVKKTIKGDTKEEQKIIDLLSEQDLQFDHLVKRTKIHAAQLGTILSLMEMKGMIKTLASGFFGLVK